MTELVRLYANDLGDKAKWPLSKFYNYVKRLEFKADPRGHESIARPRLTMQTGWPWRDCDDKSILIGSWLYLNKIPFVFRASSKLSSGRLHHVFVVAKINGKDFVLDATYPKNNFGVAVDGITYQTNLTGEIMSPTLNTFQGEELEAMDDALGWSFHSLKRGLRRGLHYTPQGYLARHAPQGYLAHKSHLMGEELVPPELLGSFFGRMVRRTKNLTKEAASSGVFDSVPGFKQFAERVSTLPGESGGGKKPDGVSVNVKEKFHLDNKTLLIGGGVLAVGAAFFLMKKK